MFRCADHPQESAAPMTRCECAELSFEQIADLADREGIETFPFLCTRTGCCSTCTACGPDLKAFLDARSVCAEDGVLETA